MFTGQEKQEYEKKKTDKEIRAEIVNEIYYKIREHVKTHPKEYNSRKEYFSQNPFLTERFNSLVKEIQSKNKARSFSDEVHFWKKETLYNFYRLLIDKNPSITDLFLYLEFFKESPVLAIQKDSLTQGDSTTLSTAFMTELYKEFSSKYGMNLDPCKNTISFEDARELICQQLVYLAMIYSHKEEGLEFYTKNGEVFSEPHNKWETEARTIGDIKFTAYYSNREKAKLNIYQKSTVFLECAAKIAEQKVKTFVQMCQILQNYTNNKVLAAHSKSLNSFKAETQATKHMKKLRDLSIALNSEQYKNYDDFEKYKEATVKMELIKIIQKYEKESSNNKVDEIKVLLIDRLINKLEKFNTLEELYNYLALYAENPILKKDTKNILKNSENDGKSLVTEEIEIINRSLKEKFDIRKSEPDFPTVKDLILSQLEICRKIYPLSDKKEKHKVFHTCLQEAQNTKNFQELDKVLKKYETNKALQTHSGFGFFGSDITVAEFLMLSTQKFVESLVLNDNESGNEETLTPE